MVKDPKVKVLCKEYPLCWVLRWFPFFVVDVVVSNATTASFMFVFLGAGRYPQTFTSGILTLRRMTAFFTFLSEGLHSLHWRQQFEYISFSSDSSELCDSNYSVFLSANSAC